MGRLSAVLLACVMLGGCGSRMVPLRNDPVLVTSHVGVETVRGAILRALVARGYRPEHEEPGRVWARYRRGNLHIRITVDYTHRQYRVSLVESEGLAAKRDRQTGEWLVHGRYARWKQLLERSITAELEENPEPYESAPPPPPPQAVAAAPSNGTQIIVVQPQVNLDARVDVEARADVQPQGDTVVRVDVPTARGAQQPVERYGCCVEGLFYGCADQGAARACAGPRPSSCVRAPAHDAHCR